MNFPQWFINIALPNKFNRVFLQADGGMGKSYSLKYLCNTLSNEYSEYGIIPMFIDAKKLVNKTVLNCIAYDYCGVSNDTEGLVLKLLNDKKYKFLIIIDAINEIDSVNVRQKVINFLSDEITEKMENVFVLISSRESLEKYNAFSVFKSYHYIKLLPLSPKIIDCIIGRVDNFVLSQQAINVLSNPMACSLFAKSENKSNYKNVNNITDVLNVFFREQKKTLSEWRKYDTDLEIIGLLDFVIDIFLPLFCRFGDVDFPIEEIEALLKKVDITKSIYRDVYINNRLDEISIDYIKIRKILIDDMKILIHDKNRVFIHEIYSSYFQAQYFCVAMDYWLENPLEDPAYIYIEMHNREKLSIEKNWECYDKATRQISECGKIYDIVLGGFYLWEFLRFKVFLEDDPVDEQIVKQFLNDRRESFSEYEYMDCFIERYYDSVNTDRSKWLSKHKESQNILFNIGGLFHIGVSRFFIGSNSFKFIYELSKEHLFAIMNKLKSKIKLDKSTYGLILEFVLNVFCAYQNNNLSNLDFSDLDLGNLSLMNVDFGTRKSKNAAKFHRTKFGNGFLQDTYKAVPSVHKDEIRVLWYTQECLCINYPHEKEYVFIFSGFVSAFTDICGTFKFKVFSNRTSFEDLNFLYISENGSDVMAYSFLIKENIKLFEIPKTESEKIQMLSWSEHCTTVEIVVDNIRTVYDLYGNILLSELLPLDKHFMVEYNCKKTIRNLGKVVEKNDYEPVLVLSFKTFDIDLGSINRSGYFKNQYNVRDDNSNIIAAKENGSSFVLNEWSAFSGELLRTLKPSETEIEKVYLQNNKFVCKGYDNNLYYINEQNVTARVELPDANLVGFLNNNELFVFLNQGYIRIFALVENVFQEFKTIPFEDIKKSIDVQSESCDFYFECYSDSLLVIVDEYENDIQCLHFVAVKINAFGEITYNEYNKVNGNYYYFFDKINNRYTGVLKPVWYNFVSKLKITYSEYDNFRFEEIQKYTFFCLNKEESTFLVSIVDLKKTLIIKLLNNDIIILKTFDDAVVFYYDSKWLCVNKDIDRIAEATLVEKLPNEKTFYITDYKYKDVYNCEFSETNLNSQYKQYLRTLGAIVE